jgi:hypothetical protein
VPRLALWNVDDAQRFVCSIVSRSGLALSWSDREHLEQYLLVECWRLSLRYQPGGPKDFDGWASGSSRFESSTGSDNGTAEPAGPSTTVSTSASGHSLSLSTIPTSIAWERLSAEAAWTMAHVAWPLSCGLSKREVADQVGETTGWIGKRLSELRGELEQLSA